MNIFNVPFVKKKKKKKKKPTEANSNIYGANAIY